MSFTAEDLEFLNSNAINGVTVKVGYVKNLDTAVKQQYENLYKRVIDERFNLCFWCDTEVFKMVEKLHATYEAHIAAPQISEDLSAAVATLDEQIEEIKEVSKKNGSKRK